MKNDKNGTEGGQGRDTGVPGITGASDYQFCLH